MFECLYVIYVTLVFIFTILMSEFLLLSIVYHVFIFMNGIPAFILLFLAGLGWVGCIWIIQKLLKHYA